MRAYMYTHNVAVKQREPGCDMGKWRQTFTVAVTGTLTITKNKYNYNYNLFTMGSTRGCRLVQRTYFPHEEVAKHDKSSGTET